MSGVCHGCGVAVGMKGGGSKPLKWCSERCRKQSYARVACSRCGGNTNYGPANGFRSRRSGVDVRTADVMCAPCFQAASRWNQETICERIKEWERLHGQPPSAREWHDMRSDDHWPYSSSVQHHFGSWNAAIAAAGFTPLPVGHKQHQRAVVA